MAKTSARRESPSKNAILDYAMLAGWIFGIGGLLVAAAVSIPRLIDRTASAQPSAPIQVVLAGEPTWLPREDRRAIEVAVLKSLNGSPLDRPGLQAAQQAAQQSGWFDSGTQVRRPDLGQVVVEGQWAVPFALVSDAQGEHLVDTKGRLLPRSYAAGQGPALLRIQGATGARPSQCGTTWPGADLAAALELIGALGDRPWKNQIAAIDISQYATDGLVRLRSDRGCELIWGRSPGKEGALEVPSHQKVAALQYLHDRHGRIDAGCQQVLDLRSDVVGAR